MEYPLIFRWTKRHENFCLSEKIFLKHIFKIKNVYQKRNMFLLSKGTKIKITCDVISESYATMPNNGFCSIGAYSYSGSKLPNDVKIGRYCSIAPNVKIMGSQHPIDWFTTSPLPYSKDFSINKFIQDEVKVCCAPFEDILPSPVIGNDVWIGEHVTIKGGVTIGDGAVIAANAVVTKDVLPYSVVAGIPARVIKFRFEKDIIEKLLNIKWWDYEFQKLPLSNSSDILSFINEFDRRVCSGEILRINYNKINISKVFSDLL